MERIDQPLNKFKILLDFERGDTSLSQTADILEARTSSDVMKALVAYREHLPYLIDASDRLEMQHNTQSGRRTIVEEVAQKLQITPRQVNRMMKNTNVITPSPYKAMLRTITHAEAQEKWKARFRSALSVIAGLETMDIAAEHAEVSSRQMYRWVTKLLLTQGLPLKDLKRLPMHKRAAAADAIETTQGEHFEHDING